MTNKQMIKYYFFNSKTPLWVQSFLVILSVGAGITLLGSGCRQQESKEKAQEGAAMVISPEIARLSAELAANPRRSDLYYARAQAFYDRESYDEAIADLQQAWQLDSTHAEYLHLLADAYLDYFKSREALRTMERAAERFPERIPTLLKLSEFQLILQQHEASLKTIDRVFRLDPQNAEGYFMFGMNFKEMGDTARAINSFQTAVENDPKLIDGWINLGQLQAALGNPIAARYFDSALRISPGNIQVMHAKAFYLQSQDKLAESLVLFREISSLDPQYTDAYFNAGLLYLDLDSIPQAYKQFQVALETNPVFIEGYYYRGVAAEIMGNKEQARRDYEQALRLAPDYQDAQEGIARLRNPGK